MKKHFILICLVGFTLLSCTKDNPVPENDQEELGFASLTFTPVTKETIEGKTVYTEVPNETSQTLKFEAPNYLVDQEEHLDLHEGETYKMSLIVRNFNNQEIQQSFINKAETHQAFLLGGDDETLDFVYGEEKNVGVTSYITIKKSDTKVIFTYIMRHLNPNIKHTIKESDWNNAQYNKLFSGADDLKLRFEAHLVDEHGH